MRIHQLRSAVVNSTYYNPLDEFNTWAGIIIEKEKTLLPSEFHFMDSHYDVYSDQSKIEIDFKNVSDIITRVTKDIVSSNVLTEKGIIKVFTKSVASLFNCDICDYLRVDDNVIRLYATSFEPSNNEDFEFQLENREYYSYGEGITGAIMLGNSNDHFFHLGTNCLASDGRQSPWHENAYSRFYRENDLHDFWVFPLYVDYELVAAFRVVKKTEQKPWTYAERLQLLYLAKWFQEFFYYAKIIHRK